MKTPLRYPGGKKKFAKIFSNFISKEKIEDAVFIEPYCGGAGAAIELLLSNEVKKIYLNDKDRSIYAFWWAILNEPKKFIKKIKNTKITVKEFYKQKEIQKKKDTADLFTLGFSTFYINRTSFSGIINAGPLGGVRQKSIYKIDCRFNKEELIKRIAKIASYKDKINIYNKDALYFLGMKSINKLQDKNCIVYADPPYFVKGGELYLNSYSHNEHIAVEKFLRKSKANVFVSYDDEKEIRRIYKKFWAKKKIDIGHFAGKYKVGKEVMFIR